ncbi:MAG: MotA/TolQ/ExbB proton channel family protein [Planctomycetota bacterium]|jgi:biopolymer transport protein ExbB
MIRSRLTAPVCAALAVPFLSAAAFAQDEPVPDAAGGLSLLDTVVAGGAIGFVIIGLSIVCVALSIEYFVTMSRDKLIPPEILGELEVLFEDDEFEEALELCEAEPSFFTNCVASGIPRITAGYDLMQESMEFQNAAETFKLQSKVGYIGTIAAVAPMLGLMGTVYGMIQAFQKIAITAGAPEPSELADSIGLALVTTLLGLIVAIPSLIVNFVLKARVTKLSIEVAEATSDLFERFTPAGRR